ncbi:hypothetical protein BCON_0209g00170 [Botryotinia convoluta]|uniref:Uncharacterized protein n=1 Tax=Botryotinia convoluta TaxID=54673 RepID=A0A4Z1HLD5_9HELO|nr:hypothetical protein BCON_0209g00170 [Botryotinia convoluta]
MFVIAIARGFEFLPPLSSTCSDNSSELCLDAELPLELYRNPQAHIDSKALVPDWGWKKTSVTAEANSIEIASVLVETQNFEL